MMDEAFERIEKEAHEAKTLSQQAINIVLNKLDEIERLKEAFKSASAIVRKTLDDMAAIADAHNGEYRERMEKAFNEVFGEDGEHGNDQG